MIRKAINNGDFHAFKANEEEEISLLQFADDTLIIGEGDTSNLWSIKAMLRGFEVMSGLRINFNKSNIYGINVVNCYKIIAVNTSRRKYEVSVKVSVHTLGTRCWRRILDFPGPGLVPNPGSGTFLNDSVNWLTRDTTGGAYLIVSLDLEKESYQKLSLPVFDDVTTLGTLRGCLSLLSSRDEFDDVLIMKEYGNENSWIKLFTVPHTNPWGDDCHYTKVLYISEDDQVLMEFCKDWTETEYNLVVYDSINNTFKIPKFQNNIHGHMVAKEIYVESLICPF
ncbi:F-box/kelch-repeat protein At3g23880-like [Vicia villosa]|uniref:F-box/kelch-repeat protein At3g23880-like n=1 Tax=Vicia villosa TaxID=3911 RepID=UPI00273B1D52|nr:F-box/kelch-repeat protein At3g23880-like [Vicia villosa]